MSIQIHTPDRGERVGERYVLVRKLATGGFASVWEATDASTGVRVAVKFMLPNRVDDDATVRRFRREAALASQLTHPNIIKVLDFGVTEPAPNIRGVPFLVMEYLEGRTLEQLMAEQGGPLRLDQIVEILTPVLLALAEAHRNGVIHRDLKPENVFILRKGGRLDAKVIDFGICKPLDTSPFDLERDKLTKTDQVFGTPEYMAPEQIAADPVGPPADVYSVGILLYEMLTGRQPFVGATAMKVMMQHLNDDLPALPEPYTRHPIAPIVKKATSKNPRQRYPTADAMREALEALPEDAYGAVPPSAAQRREMALAETADLDAVRPSSSGPSTRQLQTPPRNPTAIATRQGPAPTPELKTPPPTGLLVIAVIGVGLALAILIALIVVR